MNKLFIAVLSFIIGLLTMNYFNNRANIKNEEKQTQVVVEQIKSLKNLIVTEGTFTESYSYKDSKNYLYDYIQFQKRALLFVNAKVQASYNLGLLETKIDTLNKTIYIKKIPEAQLEIIPDIQYYDLKQSTFNSFSTKDLNKLQKDAIKRIEETAEVAQIKQRAKKDLLKELKKVYLLTSAMDWKIVDETNLKLEEQLKN